MQLIEEKQEEVKMKESMQRTVEEREKAREKFGTQSIVEKRRKARGKDAVKEKRKEVQVPCSSGGRERILTVYHAIR